MTAQQRTLRLAEWIVCYIVWIALCALGGFVLAQIVPLLLEISLALEANQWVGRAVRQLSLPIIGLIWLVLIFWSEHHLRTAIGRGRTLWVRAGRLLAAILIVYALVEGAKAVIIP
jgi:hypothetical protein